MRHVPFFRRMLTAGVVLIACSTGVHRSVPDSPELRQVDLTVLDAAPDGGCTVRWADPFDGRVREGRHRCDPGRDPILKAPADEPGPGHGWDTGFVVAEGAEQGALHPLDEGGRTLGGRVGLRDALAVAGTLLTAAGLLGGNIRATARVGGVRPWTIRRAKRLSRACELVARDHDRAVEAVREAWAPLRRARVEESLRRTPVARLHGRIGGGRLRARELERAGVRTVQEVLDSGAWDLVLRHGVDERTAEWAVTAAQGIAEAANRTVTVRLEADRPRSDATALVAAVHVLVEAGPEAREAAETGRSLHARLEPLLRDAVPASGYRHMLGAGPEARRRARAALAELDLLLDRAGRTGLYERFGRVSADLLRGADGGRGGPDAWADFGRRPAEYRGLLAELTGNSPGRTARSAAQRPGRPAVRIPRRSAV
ncbi:hypothetical protein ABZ172_01675 [Streptomyces sp. NPDC006296]|uniref:hypothetical protein n=1 Tax=Streptomyces sp. NPDC006296 TaxID=3156746 RepID=UPI00339F9DA9